MFDVVRLLVDHPNQEISQLAQALLMGEDCDYALRDALETEGVKMLGLEIGATYAIFTVTKYFEGIVLSETWGCILLKGGSSCVPDTGRLQDYLRGERPTDIERYQNPIHINPGAVVDATKIPPIQEAPSG